MRVHSVIFIGTVVVSLLLATPGVRAGILQDQPDSRAYTDPGGRTWKGRVPFRGLISGLLEWAVDVEYCVFVPGAFNLSFPGEDPTNGAKYVYAYQIFNDLDPYPPEPWWNNTKGRIEGFSVSIEDEEGLERAADSLHVDDPALVSPGDHNISASSVWYGFASEPADPIDYNEVSEVLFFTSPFTPQDRTSTVQGPIMGDLQALPSPSSTPEPASLALLVVAGILLKARRRRRR